MSQPNEPLPIRVPLAPKLGTTWPGVFQSLRKQFEWTDLQVEGTIPAELSGSFIASGPAMYTVHGTPVGSWFDGQGALHRVAFCEGKVTAWSKLVQSNDLKQEAASGYALRNRFSRQGNSKKPMH
jgi:carotenoid cleavage dioxygenase-like enzyme